MEEFTAFYKGKHYDILVKEPVTTSDGISGPGELIVNSYDSDKLYCAISYEDFNDWIRFRKRVIHAIETYIYRKEHCDEVLYLNYMTGKLKREYTGNLERARHLLLENAAETYNAAKRLNVYQDLYLVPKNVTETTFHYPETEYIGRKEDLKNYIIRLLQAAVDLAYVNGISAEEINTILDFNKSKNITDYIFKE